MYFGGFVGVSLFFFCYVILLDGGNNCVYKLIRIFLVFLKVLIENFKNLVFKWLEDKFFFVELSDKSNYKIVMENNDIILFS